MNERWQRVADLFTWATSLDAGDRARFLTIACGGDTSLRDEVEALLEADASCIDDRFLRTPIDAALDQLGHPDTTRSPPAVEPLRPPT